MPRKQNKSKETKAKSKLFRQNSFVVPEEVSDWLYGLIDVCNEDGQQQALHNLVCSLNTIWEADVWVPNPRDFVNKFFPNTDIDLLVDEGVLRKWLHSIAEHRCTRYAWNFELLVEYADRVIQALENPNCKLVNVFTLQPIKRVTSIVTNESGHRVPEIVATHIRSYSGCIFNRTRALRFFKEKKLELTAVKREKGADHKDYLYLAQCFIACCACFRAIIACHPVHLGGNLWIYNPPYEAQGSGRLTHIGGGPQNAVAELQAALFADIPNYRNLDMVSSQPNGVIQQLEKANLDPSWLIEYRDTPKAKYVYSDRAGMDLDKPEVNTKCWKDCLNSVLMGTQVVKPGLNKEGKDTILSIFVAIVHKAIPEGDCGALFEYILKYCKNNPFKAAEVYERFYNLIEPLVAVLKQWHEWLVKEYVPANQKVSKAGTYILSACDTKLYLDDLKAREKKSKIAAFLLQGQEARYIAEIARLAPKYGYKMKQNYHDGFIVELPEGMVSIPLEAQIEAAEAAGILNARLEEKPFVNPYAQEEREHLEQAREINLRAAFTGRAIEDLTPEEQAVIRQTESLEALAKEYGILDDPFFGFSENSPPPQRPTPIDSLSQSRLKASKKSQSEPVPVQVRCA